MRRWVFRSDWGAEPTGAGVGEDVRDLQVRVRELEKLVGQLVAEKTDRERTVNKVFGPISWEKIR